MKMYSKIFVMCVLVGSFFSSCKKNTDEFVPYPNSDFNDTEWSSLGMSKERKDAIVNGISKPTITVNFNAATTATINVSNTTKLTLPANATTLNSLDYFGTINANVKELTTKGDFIRNLISSCPADDLQETKGAFNLALLSTTNALLDFKNNYKLELNYNDGVSAAIGYNYQFATIKNNSLLWHDADSTKGELLYATINNKVYYQIQTNTQGWMAVNRKLSTSNTAFTSITTQLNFTNKNTKVFAVLKNFNTVIELESNTNNKFFYGNNLPENEPVTYVAISYLDGKYYLGFENAVISNNAQINIKTPINNITSNDLNTFLDSL